MQGLTERLDEAHMGPLGCGWKEQGCCDQARSLDVGPGRVSRL